METNAKFNHTMKFNCSMEWRNEERLKFLQVVVLTPIFAAGLVLNTTALWLFKRLRCWTDTHVYMFNLILADLLLILFMPFQIYDSICEMERTGYCKFLIWVHYTNMYVSMFTVAAISAHRFVLVRFPLLTKALETRRKTIACVVCTFVWIMVMVISVFYLYSLKLSELRTCYERDLQKAKLTSLLLVEIVGYVLPVAIVVTCSTGAIRTLMKAAEDSLQCNEEKNAAGRKKAVAIIKANMAVFIVCFTPLHVAYLLRYIYSQPKNCSYVFLKVSQWIAATNCCLDSVGYYFLLNKVFRDTNLRTKEQILTENDAYNVSASQRANTLKVPTMYKE